MKKLHTYIISIIALLCMSVTALAATDPTVMLKGTTDQLLAALKTDHAKIKADPTYIYGLVNKILLPHVDTIAMAQSALGRAGWMKATIPQRKAFTREFTNTVIRTYASALNAYTNEKVKYFPIRGGYQGKQVVQVNSQIVRQNGPPVSMVYSVILRGSEWRVFDLNVEGVSLLQSFRSQFSAQLSQGKSVGQIIQNLKMHNSKIGQKK